MHSEGNCILNLSASVFVAQITSLRKRRNPASRTSSHPPPALRLVARKEDKLFCECGNEWNTFGTGGSAHRAFTTGLNLNAFHAVDGRRIRSGMRSEANPATLFSCSDATRW